MGLGSAPQLRAQGPLEILDGAFSVLRHGGFERLLRGFGAGLVVAAVVLGVYYVERVEGLRTLRPLLAVALVAAWWVRCLAISTLARQAAFDLRPALPISEGVGRPLDVLVTASVFGLGLWIWLWPVAGLVMLSPYAVAMLLPLLAVRGAVAPSWHARAACSRGRGLRALGHAFDDTSGVRGVFMVVEFLILAGTVGLFVNVYATLSVGLLIGHSMLGLDVAFVSSFISPENELSLLVVACITMVLLEPLRAAVSAQAFVDARSRRDGADLHAAVDAAIESGQQRSMAGQHDAPSARDVAGAAVWVLVLISSVGTAHAQGEAAHQVAEPSAVEVVDHSPLDGEVQQHVDAILSEHEFTEFARHDTRTMQGLAKRFFDWLAELFKTEDEPEAPQGEPFRPFEIPVPGPLVLMALALVLLVIVALYVTSQRRAPTPRRTAERPSQAGLMDQAPVAYLDDAARLAAEGKPREALRALYLATLVALDRARVIHFEPAKTNWQYIRTMPRGEVRKMFARFTRIFDHKWYGHEETSLEDYQRARELVGRIVEMQERTR